MAVDVVVELLDALVLYNGVLVVVARWRSLLCETLTT